MDRRDDTPSWARAGLAAVVAAAVAGVVGAPEWMTASTPMRAILGQFACSLLLVSVLAVLLVWGRVRTWTGAFLLGAGACAFQAVLHFGPVVFEHLPLAAYGVRAAYGAGRALVAAAVLGSFELFTLDGTPVTRRRAGASVRRGTGCRSR